MNFPNTKQLLILVLVLAAILRLVRLDYPKTYVFDEVYHAFTAKEYLKGSKAAWEWWTDPPPGVAFEWTHPPLAKELMAAGMFVAGTQAAWAYRLPGAILGVVSVWLIFQLALALFKNEWVGLISAFVFSIDGLNFVQSRTGMNDIYLITFMLASLLLLLKDRLVWTSILAGLALSSKWSAIYLLGMLLILIVKKRAWSGLIWLAVIPPFIYLTTYIPFFLLGHDVQTFIGLQQQMWWYHSGLVATHDYSSPWWSWPLNLYPIWYFVDYQDNTIANIFASGNPPLFILGSIAVMATAWEFIKTRAFSLLVILLGFLIFWLPWAFSPRIMFLYHFAPSVTFLTLALGYQLHKLLSNPQRRIFFEGAMVLIILGFLIMYPYLTGIPLPKDLVQLFFKINLAKNPF